MQAIGSPSHKVDQKAANNCYSSCRRTSQTFPRHSCCRRDRDYGEVSTNKKPYDKQPVMTTLRAKHLKSASSVVDRFVFGPNNNDDIMHSATDPFWIDRLSTAGAVFDRQ